MATAMGEAKDRLSFGPFTLVVSERLLTKEDAVVELGGRAMDILIALVSVPNKVVTKKDLMSAVWPDVSVEEGSLRFHMAGLRKLLGDGKSGGRYITTIPGRGYCFVAPITSAPAVSEVAAAAATHFPYANLPVRRGRMIGRNDDVRNVSARLTETRFVTIVGPGGVGKTTVAIAVAHHLAGAFDGAVLFVDFGMIGDPQLAATAITSMVGLSVQWQDPTLSLVQFLREKRVLLVLDTCEHLADAIAVLAVAIMEAAPQVYILATSREALRVEAENVYRLDALACPPDDAGSTVAAVQQFPATQLFVECALAGGARLDVNDAEAVFVCDICRKLDGVALAIELAARRVESYGLEQTAELLDQRLTLLWHGLRTAPPRQKTLQATLDWSYELLSDVERAVLHRLAVFVGHFTLDAALDVVTSATLDRAAVFEAIDSLVEKSMVASHPIGAMMRYRLLDTTRAYALERSGYEAGLADLAARHAAYYRRWLEQSGDEWSSLSSGVERAPYVAALNNVRAALTWCFDENGDVSIGIALAAAAAPVFRAMALLPECHRWSERALQALDANSRGGSEEMQLQASFGLSLMFTRGQSDVAIAALNRSLDIAEARGDHLNEVRLLGPLHFYHLRNGEFRICLQYAKRCRESAAALGDVAATALAHTLLGVSFAIMGDLADARAELEAALESARSPSVQKVYYGFDYYSWAGIGHLTTLWLQGYPAQARDAIHQAFRDAEATEHPVAIAMVINAVAALLWIGDLEIAEQRVDWFISRAQSASFAPYLHMGRAFKGELAVRRGDFATGVGMLQTQLERLHAAHYELFTVRFHVVLASGLAANGQLSDALAVLDETAGLIEAKGYTSYLPEVLRLKGSVLLAGSDPVVTEAETCFEQSLALSRAQGSRAWEVRTATDLATLWARQGRHAEAHALLRPIYEQFTEGLDTADLQAAEGLLTRLAVP